MSGKVDPVASSAAVAKAARKLTAACLRYARREGGSSVAVSPPGADFDTPDDMRALLDKITIPLEQGGKR